MNTVQLPLLEEELKELQGKIHCLKFDIKQDLSSWKNEHKRNPAESGYTFSQRKFTRTELRKELESAYRVVLNRIDYYFEKWIDKRDLEKNNLEDELKKMKEEKQ